MELDFSRIERLERVRAEKSALSCEEAGLAKPILHDMELIPEIYGIFREILEESDFPPDIRSVTQRKKFVFIILYLYCPTALTGGRIRTGMGNALAEALGVSVYAVSKYYDDLVFLFRHYRDFSLSVSALYSELVSRLKAIGLVKCENTAKSAEFAVYDGGKQPE